MCFILFYTDLEVLSVLNFLFFVELGRLFTSQFSFVYGHDFELKMVDLVSNLSGLLAECQALPKDVLVEKLIEDKDVEQLTSIKLQLYEKCKSIKGFPNGEFYQRRKPKGRSLYSSLEERLADDVYELMTCLDTEVITPEIKAMIKKTNDSLSVDLSESQHISTPNNDEISNSSLTISRSSGWSGLKSKLASLEAGQIVFRENLAQEMNQLSSKVNNLMKSVELQCEEIKQLKAEKERQNEEMQQITSENKELRRLLSISAKNYVINFDGESEVNEKYCSGRSFTPCEDERNLIATKNTSEKGHRDQTNGVWVSANIVSESNKEIVNEAVGQIAGSNSLTKKGNRSPSEDGLGVEVEKFSGSNVVRENNNVEAPQTAKSQQLSYAEAVERNPVSSITSKENGKEVNQRYGKEQEFTYRRNNQQDDDSSSGFVGVQRKRNRTKSFFLSGIAVNVTEKQIFSFLKQKNVTSTLIRIFQSRRKQTLSAKINILSKDCTIVSQENFWPKFVKCKPWLPKTKLNNIPGKNSQTQTGNKSTSA